MINFCGFIPPSMEMDTLSELEAIGVRLADIETSVNSMNSLMLSLCLSAFAILVIYIFKFRLISKDPAGNTWLGALAEYPIDLCITLIPIIAVGTVENEHPYFGILLILVAIVVIFFAYKLRGCYFRKKNSGGKFWYHLFMIANYILTGAFIGIVVLLIQNSWTK